MTAPTRVVAELGRPETADETAARKAESSRVYRTSQTARNLVAALLVTLGIVLVVVFAVPRGEPAPRDPIDVAAVAQQVQDARDVRVVVPSVPADWSVNAASITGDGTEAWTIVYALPGGSGFVRVVQAFNVDDTWASQVLRGAAARDTTTIDAVTWDRYTIANPSASGNVSAALGVQAGDDHILIYGAATQADLELVAGTIGDQVRAQDTETR